MSWPKQVRTTFEVGSKEQTVAEKGTESHNMTQEREGVVISIVVVLGGLRCRKYSTIILWKFHEERVPRNRVVTGYNKTNLAVEIAR